MRVLVLAGASALLLSIQVAIAISRASRRRLAVVPAGLPGLSDRRRRVRRGAGRTWRPIVGLIAAAALLIDYVMTVSVSTAAAIAQIQSVIPQAYDVRIEIAFISISLITIANLRGLRESGNIFAVPTYLFVVLALGIIAIGLVSAFIGGNVAPVPPEPDAVPLGTEALDDPAPAQGIRRRLRRVDRRRGDRQRRPGVQAARGEERREHADRDVDPARHPVRRSDPVRRPVRPATDPGGRRIAGRARGTDGVRRWFGAVRHVRGEHRPDPVPRREHVLQRLPAPRRDPRRGRLHAAPVLLPRRSARVLVGHRAAGGHRVRAAGGVRRRYACPDPAVLGRRLRVLHPQPDRHGQALVHASRKRAGGGERRSTRSARCSRPSC